MMLKFFLTVVLWFLSTNHCYSAGISDNIVYAVNCGGDAHTDEHGIKYRKDNLKAGITSDYGRNIPIQRVAKEDQIIYQTERYDLKSFAYEIEVTDDGDYVLWLKFAEVWFNSPNMKVFEVILNDEHTVIEDLDIFTKAGRATAHDEYVRVPFQIKNGRLVVKGKSTSYNGKLKVEFQRLDRDNPKCNALIIWKGNVGQIPKLPPLPQPEALDDTLDQDENEEPPSIATKQKRHLKTSGPKVADPYSEDQSSSLIPLFIAIACVIPIIFCLCRL
ncbi:unnamed protein product [Didymodactylos carnosus]|uniref:Malectin domain-containing protein n=1 Tax=Didymodactylos carnosus TaxID=1234261 RepID=A0A813VSQ5_9BILA|nr:unnamed protein product [Didymodactylos carnosus]CAF1166156.1 unnamed protein product [Didymodactylos carnosus]CAF3629323.1 unnamed protein product [Didymodactylos carnosus]CAF3977783.1 unnamed protein product [Didymodactylos carnosus]